MKTLLLAATAIAMIASASAQTMDGAPDASATTNSVAFFECVITRVTPADKGDRDPIYKVNVSIMANGEFDTVVHTSRSGATYDRVEQYTNLETGLDKKSGWPMWAGQLKKNRVQTIVGSFFAEGKQKKAHYVEMIFGKDHNKPATIISSDCHPIQA